MIRRIIQIDEEKCNGCGACAEACHEGAIGMVNGKATLLRDDYCDGLGDCLPTCPTGAISFVEREAAAYDEKAVQENMRKKAKSNHAAVPHTGCPGSRMQRIQHSQETTPSARVQTESQLGQWPCQIKLVPTNALYFDGAKLLIAADCSAYAYARMHEDFMRGKITIIGCPKLDSILETAFVKARFLFNPNKLSLLVASATQNSICFAYCDRRLLANSIIFLL